MPNLKEDNSVQEEARFLKLDLDSNPSDIGLHTKMDRILEMLSNIQSSLENHKQDTGNQLECLKQENENLKLCLMEAEGQAARMSKNIKKLKQNVQDLEVRLMSHNIVVYNVPEQVNEDIYKTVSDIFLKTLKIPDQLIHSEKHPVAPVQIDVAHRMGKANHKNRPIVIKLVLRRGKDIILQHARNLKGTNISLSEQLPTEMRERRMLQLPKMKALRDQHKSGGSTRIVLAMDKLFVNNALVPSDFESNPLSVDKPEDWTPLSYNSMQHSEVLDFSGSSFQGHMIKIASMDEVKKAYFALLQNFKTAAAHHIMYTYSFSEESSTTDQQVIHQGHSDDGEYGGSQVLTRLFKESKLSNIFLSVSRIHNGPNIGRKRFDLIEACARSVLYN